MAATAFTIETVTVPLEGLGTELGSAGWITHCQVTPALFVRNAEPGAAPLPKTSTPNPNPRALVLAALGAAHRPRRHSGRPAYPRRRTWEADGLVSTEKPAGPAGRGHKQPGEPSRSAGPGRANADDPGAPCSGATADRPPGKHGSNVGANRPKRPKN